MPEPLVSPTTTSGGPGTWCAIGAVALLYDKDGERGVMVKPTYHDRGLILIGGGVGQNEDPRAALRREIREETGGLERAAGRPLVTEWVRADPVKGKPAGFTVVFDVAPLGPGDWDRIVLPRSELQSKHLVPRDEFKHCTTDRLLIHRTESAIRARDSGTHEFLFPPD